MSNKLKLKLDEGNKFHVALSIKGSSSEPLNQAPVVRFAITERKSGFSCSFPTEKKSDGVVSINIPSMAHVFHEGEGYEGKLEVYVGNQYATPTVVDIEFVKSLQVEASLIEATTEAVIKKEPAENAHNQTEDDLSEVEHVIKQPNKPKPLPKSKPIDQRIVQKAVFSENKPVKQVVSKPVQPVSIVKHKIEKEIVESKHNAVQDELEAYKEKLKSLIADAVKEI